MIQPDPTPSRQKRAVPAAGQRTLAYLHGRHRRGDRPLNVNGSKARHHPRVGWTFRADWFGVEDLDRMLFMVKPTLAVAGCALQPIPSDQPQLQQSKGDTARALEQSATAVSEGNRDVPSLIEGTEALAYLTVLGYPPYSDAGNAAVGRLCAAVRGSPNAATTFSYGPRCLHSAGQLNKGGSATRMSPQLGQERDRDLKIPGRGYSFRRVINTRAQRDLRALGVHGLKVVPVRLPADDPAGAIDDTVATQGKGSG